MLPVIAIVGRPNVGKSTLFNQLTRSRDALVANFPGLTRDRQYGQGVIDSRPHIIIDTGGFEQQKEGVFALMAKQTHQAIEEADAVMFVVDAKAGLTPQDEALAQLLRVQHKPIFLVVNKIDHTDAAITSSEFHKLGFSNLIPIAAVHGRGVKLLISKVLSQISKHEELPEVIEAVVQEGIKVAIVGRPNVGKSTLVNRMLGEDRVLVFDLPGTTRDSIFIPFERMGKHYTLIDTAGVRRRGRVSESIEKFSVVKTLQAIQASNVAVLVIDAREGITDQDMHLLGFILDAGKGLIVAVNKWDGLTQDEKSRIRSELDRRIDFADFAKWHYISALHGSGVGDLFKSIEQTYQSANKKIQTQKLNQVMQKAIEAYQPPLIRGRRVKLRYAHLGGNNPPVIVIHGTQVASLPKAYQRYLINYFRDAFKFVGTPIRLELKNSENPYADRVNILTPRQKKTRERLRTVVKKK